jgi:hypothetical protein
MKETQIPEIPSLTKTYLAFSLSLPTPPSLSHVFFLHLTGNSNAMLFIMLVLSPISLSCPYIPHFHFDSMLHIPASLFPGYLCWFYIIGITNDHKYSGLKHKLI